MCPNANTPKRAFIIPPVVSCGKLEGKQSHTPPPLLLHPIHSLALLCHLLILLLIFTGCTKCMFEYRIFSNASAQKLQCKTLCESTVKIDPYVSWCGKWVWSRQPTGVQTEHQYQYVGERTKTGHQKLEKILFCLLSLVFCSNMWIVVRI